MNETEIPPILRGEPALGSLSVAMAPYVKHREDALINRLVAEHRAGTLTEPMMRSMIAAIAELRSLADDLRRGHVAGERPITVKGPGR